jgi:hypothetical protein
MSGHYFTAFSTMKPQFTLIFFSLKYFKAPGWKGIGVEADF